MTCTTVYAGKREIFLEEKENCQVLKINNPILTNTDMFEDQKNEKKDSGLRLFRSLIIKYEAGESSGAPVRGEVDKAYIKTEQTFWYCLTGMWMKTMAIPSLLAVSAVHQHLVATKNRPHFL